MLKSRLLVIIIMTVLVITSFAAFAQARLLAGSPERVISESTLILTGKVVESIDNAEERSFTVSVNQVLKGDYTGNRISFFAQKTPGGWMGFTKLPETNTELLLFLRNDDSGNPYFTFDLNCIAIIEGQQVISLLGGSNVGINDERWEIEDYIEAYNEFFNTVNPISKQTEPVHIDANSGKNQESPTSPIAVTASVFWPGIIVFLILLGLSLAGLWHYARSKQSRSPMFWVVGIVVCVVVAYVIATFIVTPLLIR